MRKTITLSYEGTQYNLDCTVIKSRRKTYSISIDEGSNILFRVPLSTDNRQLLQIAEEKKRWIITHYQKRLSEKENQPVSDLTEVQRQALEVRYKEAARSYIPSRVSYYHAMTGGSYRRIAIRDQKTRWGSCSSKGTLSFNWRLMLAPPSILDYVVVHELCHLTYMNHSTDFWHAVERIYPDYRTARKWLKDHGHELAL